jgi:hypothetical protein
VAIGRPIGREIPALALRGHWEQGEPDDPARLRPHDPGMSSRLVAVILSQYGSIPGSKIGIGVGRGAGGALNGSRRSRSGVWWSVRADNDDRWGGLGISKRTNFDAEAADQYASGGQTRHSLDTDDSPLAVGECRVDAGSGIGPLFVSGSAIFPLRARQFSRRS